MLPDSGELRLGKHQHHLIKLTSSCLSPELSGGQVKGRGGKPSLPLPTESVCSPHAGSLLHLQALALWKAIGTAFTETYFCHWIVRVAKGGKAGEWWLDEGFSCGPRGCKVRCQCCFPT